MNHFYAPPENWFANGSGAVLEGQEARHISQVLRHKVGDMISVSDGRGSHFNCEIREITKKQVSVSVLEARERAEPMTKKVLAMGTIKKRDRLEYAVEKAVELDAWEICLFNADHSERSKLNEDRLRAIIVSAFKQSGRYFLPELVVLDSLDATLQHYKNHRAFMAHEKNGLEDRVDQVELNDHNLLLVGPEGGFSDREVDLITKQEGRFVNLGTHRLRAETAVTAFLANFIYTFERGPSEKD